MVTKFDRIKNEREYVDHAAGLVRMADTWHKILSSGAKKPHKRFDPIGDALCAFDKLLKK